MLTIFLISLAILFAGLISFLGIIFYFYCQALKQAHEEGWDMPS